MRGGGIDVVLGDQVIELGEGNVGGVLNSTLCVEVADAGHVELLVAINATDCAGTEVPGTFVNLEGFKGEYLLAEVVLVQNSITLDADAHHHVRLNHDFKLEVPEGIRTVGVDGAEKNEFFVQSLQINTAEQEKQKEEITNTKSSIPVTYSENKET